MQDVKIESVHIPCPEPFRISGPGDAVRFFEKNELLGTLVSSFLRLLSSSEFEGQRQNISLYVHYQTIKNKQT